MYVTEMVKFGRFRSHLEAYSVSSDTEPLWYNEIVLSVDDYIYIYIYIFIYFSVYAHAHKHAYFFIYIYIYLSIYKHIQTHHHHHHIVPPARISLTVSRHFSQWFIASGRSSGLHPVSSHSCCMYVRAGCLAFARPYVGVHRSTSFMSLSLLLQQCPACLVRLTWIVFVMGGRWPYSCCLQDLINTQECCEQHWTLYTHTHTHTHTHTYIYIYICVCVCGCVCV